MATKALSNGILKRAINNFVKIGVDVTGEGFEEVFSQFVSNLGSSLYKEENLGEILFNEEALQGYLDSAIGGFVLGGGMTGVNVGSSVIAGKDYASGLTKNERAVVEKVYEAEVAKEAENGKVTLKKKAQIYEDVLRQMEKGYISTDTIEEVLGGEAYKTYKDTVDSEDSQIKELETQIKALEEAPNTVGNAKKYDSLKTKLEELKSKSDRAALKSQLGQQVSQLVKDSKLNESYLERGRAREQFQADVSQYTNEAAKQTVQNAIDHGMNNQTRSHEFVEALAKLSEETGRVFDFTDNKRLKEAGYTVDGAVINGFLSKDGITLNLNSKKALNTVVGHEITHILEGTQEYDALQQAMQEYVNLKGEGTWDRMLAETADLYKNIAGADYAKELTADLVGEYLFTDQEFVTHLSRENPNIFQMVYEEIKYLVKTFTGTTQGRQLEQVKRTFDEAWKAQKNAVQVDGVRYSLSKDAKTELHKALYDKNYQGEVLLRDISPPIMLAQKGVKNLPMSMKASHIRENVFTEEEAKNLGLRVDRHTHYHGLTEDLFLKIIDGLDDVKEAYRGTKNADDPTRGEKYFLLVSEFMDKDGNTINVPVYIDEHAQFNRAFIDVNKISTAFGRNNFRDYINRQIRSKNLVRIKNRSIQTSESNALIARDYGENASTDSIRNPDEVVNNQFSLSEIDQAYTEANTQNTDGWRVYGEDVEVSKFDIAPPVPESARRKAPTQPGDPDFAPPVPGMAGQTAIDAEQNALDEAYRRQSGEEGYAPELYDADEYGEVETARDRLEVKLKNAEYELRENKRLREKSVKPFDQEIQQAQTEYDNKKHKDRKNAQELLRKIEKLKRQKADRLAEYDKNIHDIENRIDRLNGELNKDHSKKDRLEAAYERIDKRLAEDEAALAQEYYKKRNALNEEIKDHGKWIRTKASDLEWEMGNWVQGTSKASPVLKMMRSAGYEWRDIMGAASAVKNDPNQITGKSTPAEMALRELLGREYDEKAYELEDMEAAYQQRLKELKEDAEEQREFAKRKEQRQTRTELHQQKVDGIKAAYSEKGMDFDVVLKNAKNLSAFATVDNTPQRVMEKALGYKEGQILADATVNKVAQNETEAIKWLNTITDRKNGLLKKLSDKYSIKPGSNESAAAQMYAEGFYVNEKNEIIQYGDAELAKDFPDLQVQKNIKGLARDPLVRQFYDETLDAINASRTRNCYPEIPKLDNYFLHFRAMEDAFSRLGIPFNPESIKAKDLPTDLNGVTADLKPGQPYFASAKHREGKRTSFDLLGGMERYATSAKNQIYHIDDIQTLRALRNYIADTYGQAEGLNELDMLSEEEAQERIKDVFRSHLSTFAKFLNEEANVLAGKTSLIDRGIEGVIGRKGITFLDTVNRQVGSNMVGYNLSSPLTNFVPVVQTFAKTNKGDFLKALGQTVLNKIGAVSDSFAQDSSVMVRRKGSDRFYRTLWQKLADPGYALMGAVDDISTEIIARTKFNEFTRKGMEPKQAHYKTDKWVSRLMGDRSLGQMPQLYNSKMLGLITKFQLEVRNQLDSQFYDTIQESKVSSEYIEDQRTRNAAIAAKATSTFVQLAVVQHLFGIGFEALAGYNPAFDIIETIITAFGWDDDEDSEDTALDNLGQGLLALMEDMPYTSTFTGGRVPISSAFPDIEQLLSGKDEYGSDVSRLETVAEVIPYWLLPGGYGQAKKTAQGIGMYLGDKPISGSYTDGGNLRFPVEEGFAPWLQAALFGQWSGDNARDYFDNERTPLNKEQVQEYIDTGMSIQEYWAYRDGLSALNKQSQNGTATLNEKGDYIGGLDLTVEQKNILINNIADRDTPIDMRTYADYPNFAEFDYGTQNPGKYALAQAVGGYDSYMGYREALNDIKAEKDADGNDISGSREKKVVDYINGLDADYGEKIILYVSKFSNKKSRDTYGYEIIDYLNSRTDISYSQMEAILVELGFTVSPNGRITWD